MKYTTWLVALATGLVASGAAADDVANKDQASSSDRRDHLRVGAIGLSHSVTGTTTAMSIPQLTTVANAIGGTVLPTIDLLKLGFLL